jgi:hypothetical protein
MYLSRLVYKAAQAYEIVKCNFHILCNHGVTQQSVSKNRLQVQMNIIT